MPKTLSLSEIPKKRNSGFKKGLAIIGILGLSASAISVAHAHQSPGGCNSNRLNISIVKNKTEVRNGDTLIYTVTASNPDNGSDIACDVTDVDITLQLPAADGTPTGTLVTVASDQNFPGGTPVTLMGTVSYVVDVNPGVVDIVARGRAIGVLHDAPTDHSAEIIKTLGTSVIEDTDEGGPGDNPTTPSTPGVTASGTSTGVESK